MEHAVFLGYCVARCVSTVFSILEYSIWRFCMQIKLNTIVAAAVVMFGGAAYAQDMVVKIGHVGPTSGGIAHLGKDNENGARMAIDELNAKGTMIGGKKVKFELQAEDDAGDPKQGTAVAQKLADDKGT